MSYQQLIYFVKFNSEWGYVKFRNQAGLLALVMGVAPVARGSTDTLLIGDSHTVGSFGRALDGLLRERNQRVTTVARCGTSAHQWFSGEGTSCGFWDRLADGTERRGLEAETPRIEGLLATEEPATVVIALGANLMGASGDFIRESVARLVGAVVVPGRRCVWIGPPHARAASDAERERVIQAIRAGIGEQCSFIDSRPHARYPDTGGDGVHFDHLGEEGRALAEGWARTVFLEIGTFAGDFRRYCPTRSSDAFEKSASARCWPSSGITRKE